MKFSRSQRLLGRWASALLLVACGDAPGALGDGPMTSGQGANSDPFANDTDLPETENSEQQGRDEVSAEAEVGSSVNEAEQANENAQLVGSAPDAQSAGDNSQSAMPADDRNPDSENPVDTADGETDGVLDSPVPPVVQEVPTNCSAGTNPTDPVGYGAATTGGGESPAVIANSFEEAEGILADFRAAFKDGSQESLVLRYTGQFDFGTIGDVCEQHEKDSRVLQIKEVENVTFEGAPGSSANFGIKINRARNVIVRNMTMGLLPGGGDSDAITIEGNGTNGDVENVWIDHNELFSSTKSDCPGAGDTEFDGLIDIKKGARRITVSYNHLHDHQKTGLIGHSDSDDMERFVTFHHNWYENVVSRTPLHRFGFIHLFNNYYNQISGTGINVRMGGVALIEANFFENTANPITSRYSDEPGFWDLRDNFVGEGITWSTDSSTLANADDWQSTATYPDAELDYAYNPDLAGCTREIVTSNAGATL